MKKKSVFIAIVFIISGLTFSSCLKEKKTYDTSFSQDHAYVENVFNNVSGMADEAYELSSNRSNLELATSYYLSECTEVILDLSANPYLLSIDFGEENCLCNDGRYRRGKILTTFTGMYREPGTIITHTPEDYYVDNDEVMGTMVITNTGLNELDHMQYNVQVTGEVHKANNEGVIYWNSDRMHEWVEGRESIEILDDVYLISGMASAESTNKTVEDGSTNLISTWEINTIEPLRVALNCNWVSAGSLSVNASGWDEAIIEYGTGDCDNEIFVIYNGKTYTIKLP